MKKHEKAFILVLATIALSILAISYFQSQNALLSPKDEINKCDATRIQQKLDCFDSNQIKLNKCELEYLTCVEQCIIPILCPRRCLSQRSSCEQTANNELKKCDCEADIQYWRCTGNPEDYNQIPLDCRNQYYTN